MCALIGPKWKEYVLKALFLDWWTLACECSRLAAPLQVKYDGALWHWARSPVWASWSPLWWDSTAAQHSVTLSHQCYLSPERPYGSVTLLHSLMSRCHLCFTGTGGDLQAFEWHFGSMASELQSWVFEPRAQTQIITFLITFPTLCNFESKL